MSILFIIGKIWLVIISSTIIWKISYSNRSFLFKICAIAIAVVAIRSLVLN